MTRNEILEKIKNKFGPKIIESNSDVIDPYIRIDGQDIPEIMNFLKEDSELDMKYLNLLSGVDWPTENRMEVVYHLSSLTHHHSVVVKCFINRENPIIPTVSDIWGTANWHERETYDLLGIKFEGHPNMTRIFMEEDWVGYPLRKDYVFPEEYHGIKWA